MSNIFEFSEKIKKDKGASFVSFESMIGKKETNDPLDILRKEQESISRETEAMIAAANAEKKRIEEEAFQKGFDRGLEEGRATAQQEFDEKIAGAVNLIQSLEQEKDTVHKQYEEDLLALVKTMVERLVGHEVSVNPLVIRNTLRKAMEYVVEGSTVTIHLHADDLQRIKEMSLEDPSLLAGTKRIELVEDPLVSSGGCLLNTAFGEIDATLENCREKLFAAVERAFLAALAEDDGEQ